MQLVMREPRVCGSCDGLGGKNSQTQLSWRGEVVTSDSSRSSSSPSWCTMCHKGSSFGILQAWVHKWCQFPRYMWRKTVPHGFLEVHLRLAERRSESSKQSELMEVYQLHRKECNHHTKLGKSIENPPHSLTCPSHRAQHERWLMLNLPIQGPWSSHLAGWLGLGGCLTIGPMQWVHFPLAPCIAAPHALQWYVRPFESAFLIEWGRTVVGGLLEGGRRAARFVVCIGAKEGSGMKWEGAARWRGTLSIGGISWAVSLPLASEFWSFRSDTHGHPEFGNGFGAPHLEQENRITKTQLVAEAAAIVKKRQQRSLPLRSLCPQSQSIKNHDVSDVCKSVEKKRLRKCCSWVF